MLALIFVVLWLIPLGLDLYGIATEGGWPQVSIADLISALNPDMPTNAAEISAAIDVEVLGDVVAFLATAPASVVLMVPAAFFVLMRYRARSQREIMTGRR